MITCTNSGENMIQKFVFEHSQMGPSVLILGAIHGNEVAGPIALQRLIEDITSGKVVLKKGRLTLVPVCHEQANRQNVRQIDENLNRVMHPHKNPQTCEQKLANELCPLIEQHDILLDLHSTHCQGDVPFVFCDYPTSDNLKLIEAIDVDYVLLGWPQIYSGHADITDYSTERYAHDCHKSGVTLECGYHKEPKATDVAYNAVLNVLKQYGMIDGISHISHCKTNIYLTEFIIKRKNGRLCQNYKHLDRILKGQKIAQYDDGEVLTASRDGYILLPNGSAEIGTEWYYLGTQNK